MTGFLSRQFRLLLAGVFGVVLAGASAHGQDPFVPPPATDEKVESPKTDSAKTASAKESKSTPKEPERIFRTIEEWQKRLTPEQFMVTRMKATEPAFSGKYASGHFKGVFVCVCCGAKLFDANHKFESGTGWPSFWRPLSEKVLDTAMDYNDPAEARVEVMCHRCGAHLGHVFQDGPPPTGLRYCMNSLALSLQTEKGTATSSRKVTRTQTARSTRKTKPSSQIATKQLDSQSQTAEPKS